MAKLKPIAQKSNIIGIDIGDYSLKLAEISGRSVKRAVFAPTPDGLVRDGEIISTDAMAEFISETAKAGGISRGKCAVVLPSAVVYSKTITVPAMTEQQLKYSLPFEFRDYVSEEKGKYFYDYAVQAVTNDEEGEPKELELFSCAAPRATIAEYRSMLRQAGFTLKSAAPAACAYSGLISDYEQREELENGDYCFIDLGHSSTAIYMFNGKNYNTHRSLNISAADVINAVADSMNVDEHMARSYVLTNYQQVLESEACMQVYSRIAVEVVKAINFYNFNNRDNYLGNVFVCGGGAGIAPLCDTISQTLGLEVKRVDQIMPACPEDNFDPCLYARAVGIALQD